MVEEFQDRAETLKASCGPGSEPAYPSFCHFLLNKAILTEWADPIKLQDKEHGPRDVINWDYQGH